MVGNITNDECFACREPLRVHPYGDELAIVKLTVARQGVVRHHSSVQADFVSGGLVDRFFCLGFFFSHPGDCHSDGCISDIGTGGVDFESNFFSDTFFQIAEVAVGIKGY